MKGTSGNKEPLKSKFQLGILEYYEQAYIKSIQSYTSTLSSSSC